MTLTLGWKSAVVAALLVAMAALGIWLAVRSARQRSITDWEREQRIGELSERLEKAQAEIDRISAEADALRDQRDGETGKLSEALARLRALQAIPAPTPEQREETCVACEAAVVLLESSLRLADMESLSLRRELAIMEVALVDAEEMFVLQTKRLAAASKDKKKIKRRNIWTLVSVAAANLTLGFGIGRL
jgi:chromosome segregation ATPase